ncbi:hypothetical protein DBV14_12775 [Variovorax sp. KBW07]|uniref:hypothetical protein n=1 Tax=Variovorax sp. KBW07 TaxID=2153358 RepID=UPI000F562FB7|nr:hypothetical protein [Variovorax sp. KBW07]RQO54632.1 hypothetical protein DBV14_12775 [Variovorax sp. KBW07]
MNIRSHSTMALAWLALAALSVPAAADGVPAPRSAKHSAAQRAAPMTVAARKPNDSGVTLRYQLETTPQAGKATTVVLQFDGVSHPDGATVRLATDAGLTLSGNSTLTLPTGKRTTANVSVVSEGEGLAYLNVFITQGSATSAISIPIQAGSATPALKASGVIKSTPDGENIISMPAK